MIRIFVGSDIHQHEAGAEEVLEYSIGKHTSSDFEITWMRAGPVGHPLTAPGFAVSKESRMDAWCICRTPGQAWPKKGWGTDFSAFRVAVPELAGFQGKAIYLDVDMLVLGDIQELYDLPQSAPYLCNDKRSGRTEVGLIQCEPFGKAEWWPRLDNMKPSGLHLPQYRAMLLNRGWFDDSLPWDWNTVDQFTPTMKLQHYSAVPTQPWRPYPTVQYGPHRDPRVVDLWFQYRDEARSAQDPTGSG